MKRSLNFKTLVARKNINVLNRLVLVEARAMLLLALLLLVSPCHAMWPRSWIVGMACGKAAEMYFPECSYGDFQCICGHESLQSAVVDCIAKHTKSNSTQMGEAWGRFSLMYCYLNGVEDNVDDIISAGKLPLTEQVSDANFTRAFNAEYHLLAQKDVSVRFSIGLCIYWVGIAALAGLARLGRKVASLLVGPRLLLQSRHSKWYRWLQRKFFWPAFYGRRHMVRYKFGWITFSLATRFESLAILGFLLLCLIFMLTPYQFMDDDPFFTTRWKEMMRYCSDRSGIMGTILIPLFVLFGMRNNILIWITGWSYSRFNAFHRAIARISYALLIIHSVTKHIFAASYHGSMSKYFYSTRLYQYGVASMCLMALMIGFAMIRNRFYRVFHHVHVFCGLAALVCAIYHLDHIGYREPLYLCLAIWAADWALRLLRVLVFNFSTFFPPIPGSHRVTYASVRLFNEDIACFNIRLPVKWTFYPGQFIYLYPHRYWLLNGHPFSVVGSTSSGNGIELFIKARNGMTKALCRDLLNRGCTETSVVTIPVFIEGPYGVSAPIHNYDEGLLIAGGIGITGILGYVEKMRVAHEDSRVRNIHLVWVVHSRQQIAIAKESLLSLKASGGIQITIYCRSERSRSINKFPEQLAAASGENVVVDYDPRNTTLSMRSSSTTDSSGLDGYEKRHGDQSTDYSYGGLELYRSTTDLPYEAGKRISPQSNSELTERMNALREAGLDDDTTGYDDDEVSGNQVSPFADSADECTTIGACEDIQRLINEARPDLTSLIRTFFNQSQGSVCVAACGPPGMLDTISGAVCDYMEFVEYGQVHYFEEAFAW